MGVSTGSLPHLFAAPPRGPHERRLADLALTVLVGVTGVGKSTALDALRRADPGARVLPDRREVTDHAIILPRTGVPVTDRAERFRLTAWYRAEHPGGMAQALGSLTADTGHWGDHPIFDGLRGREEVEYAAEHVPRWRFVALHAPDTVRVRRLLGRADAFDRVAHLGAAGDLRAELAALPGAAAVFTPGELDGLAALTAQGYAPADILAKAQIVVTERQHYDPGAAAGVLRALPPERALILDTVRLSPAEVAAAVRAWA